MVAPFLTPLMENLPSMSVIAPLVVPFTTTDAPMTGSPAPSFTIPLQASFCCCTETDSLEAYAGSPPATPMPRHKSMLTSLTCFCIKIRFRFNYYDYFLTKRSIIVQIYEINQITCKKNKKIPFWRLFCFFLLSFGVLYILYKQLEIKS